ncbi:MAG TPA: hypothetical protein VNZ49_08115 [Bacteroidia bacterium]|jgi:hypothetical protein|nr:hypothetical protein [Bacteroidia bacterium]
MTKIKHAGLCRNVRSRWLGNPRGVVGFVRAGSLLFLLFLFSFSSYAQVTKTDSVTHFKVKYSDDDYKFFPEDGYLFAGSKNKLKITNTRGVKFEVKLTNGSITKSTDSIFTIEGLSNFGVTLVSIFETDMNGKKKLALNKPFTVVSFPKVKFGGVACDSTMPALILAVGTMSVYYKSINKKVPVTSFKMEFYEKEKFVSDSSANNRLSKKMMAYVEKLKPGSLVYLSNIKYKDPNGAEHTEPVYRVFIIKDKEVFKFGVNN